MSPPTSCPISYSDCYVCGKLFVVRRAKRAKNAVITCREPACRRVLNADQARDARRRGLRTTVRRLVDRVCAHCGVSYQGRNDKDYDSRFCSVACRCAHDSDKAVYVEGRKLTRKERLKLVYVEPVDREAVFERDGWRCHICKNSIDPKLGFDPERGRPHLWSATTDHVVPLAGLQGTHEMANVRAAHWICNARKADKAI